MMALIGIYYDMISLIFQKKKFKLQLESSEKVPFNFSDKIMKLEKPFEDLDAAFCVLL